MVRRRGRLTDRAKDAEEIEMRNYTSERGMSLIEATIVLMVMAILVMLLAPTVGDYVNDARQVAARKDVESIGEGILRLLSDTGSRCLRLAGTTDCTIAKRVDLLVSAGDNPIGISASVTDITLPDSEAATPASVIGRWPPSHSREAASGRPSTRTHTEST